MSNTLNTVDNLSDSVAPGHHDNENVQAEPCVRYCQHYTENTEWSIPNSNVISTRQPHNQNYGERAIYPSFVFQFEFETETNA